MLPVKVFQPLTEDVSGKGYDLSVVNAVATETVGGAWEIQMDIARTGDWWRIQKGCIVTAVVPMRPTPSSAAYAATLSGWSALYATLPYTETTYPGGPNASNVRNVQGISTGYTREAADCMVLGSSGEYRKIRLRDGSERWVDSARLTEGGTTFTAARKTDLQLFLVYSATRSLDSPTVKVAARHWSYALENVFVGDIDEEGITAEVAIQTAKAKALERLPGIVDVWGAPVGGSVKADWRGKNLKQCLLDPADGVVPQACAILDRDNADYILSGQQTESPAVTLRYGHNLLGVKWQDRADAQVTRIMPVAKTADSEDLLLPEKYVDSPYYVTESYIHPPKAERMELNLQIGKTYVDGTGTEITLDADNILPIMRQMAGRRFSTNHIDAPKHTLSVEFLLLGDSEEYKQYKGLETLTKHDLVRVYAVPMGIDMTMRLRAYKWDCLQGRYLSAELGDPWDYTSIRQVAGYELATGSVSTRASGGGGGKAAAKTKDDLEKLATRYELTVDQTNEHFAILATAEKWSELRNAYLIQNKTYFEITAAQISSKVSQTDFDELDRTVGTYHTEILQNANKISLIATAEELATAQTRQQSIFTIQAGQISSKVSANGVISAINQTPEQITISASKVNLEGLVTAEQLNTTNAQITNLRTGQAHFSALNADGSIITTGEMACATLRVNNALWASKSLTGIGTGTLATFLGTDDADLNHTHTLTVSESGGNVTITVGATKVTQGNTESKSFNMAATQWYADQVAAYKTAAATALADAGWSGTHATTFTATLDGANKRLVVNSATCSVMWPGASSPATLTVGLGNLDLSTALDNYTAGITVGAPTFSGNGTADNTTVTAAATNGQSNSVALYLVRQTAWSSGTRKVHLKSDSNTGTTRAEVTVSMPDSATWSGEWQGSNFAVQCTAGGKTYTKVFST